MVGYLLEILKFQLGDVLPSHYLSCYSPFALLLHFNGWFAGCRAVIVETKKGVTITVIQKLNR